MQMQTMQRLFLAICVSISIAPSLFAREYSKVEHFSYKEVKKPKMLGTIGQTYEPIEDDLWEHISNSKLNTTDAYQKLEQAKKDSMIVSLGIPTCEKNSTKNIDISFTVKEDVYLYGLVVAKKGQVINPLKHTRSVRKDILFFNINDKSQKKMADDNLSNGNTIVLATDGDLSDYVRKEQNTQKASSQMIEKYQVECVPAIVGVSPDGAFLKVFQFTPPRPKKVEK